MKKLSTLFAIILLIPLLISHKPPRGNKSYVEGQIMVQLKTKSAPQRQQQALDKLIADFRAVNLEMIQKLSAKSNIVLLGFNPDLADDNRLLEEIKAQPDVELAQFNHYVQQREIIPDDQFFGLQWNLNNTGQTGGIDDADIDAPEAWGLGTSGITATGDTIVVAIVDDGFEINHEDLLFWKNYHEIPGNGIDDDNNGYIDDYDGWNVYNSSGQIIPADHGTHVAGIAAAKGNNSIGVSGVNMHVRIMPVVASSTNEAVAVAGYAYVLEMRQLYNETGGQQGAFVVSTNCSFGVNNGNPADYPIWGAMYDSLGLAGVLSAGATANANLNIDINGDIPTAFPSDYLITVTNTDKNDAKNDFAAYGLTTIDLGAPGTSIYSTRLITNGNYGYKTGTSMASPHVAGAVAYLFSVANENFMTAYHDDPAGMALLIKQYILQGTDPLPSLAGKTVTGGRLNIYNAAQRMMDPDMVFNPLSLFKLMTPNSQDSSLLSFTNNTSLTLSYAITYPDAQTWLSLTGPLSGSLAAYSTGSVMAHFNTAGYNEDTLSAFITFNYGDGKQFQVPVHIYVVPAGWDLSLNISVDHREICIGTSALITSDVVGGSGVYSYSWTSSPAGFTSTEANVSVSPFVATTYYLTVSDGNAEVSDSIQITVRPLPDKPVIASGPATVDNFMVTTSTYDCGGLTNGLTYQWHVTPAEAGTTTSTGTLGEFTWTDSFTGTVQVTVSAVNDCGNSEISDAFSTQIYTSQGVVENGEDLTFILYPNPASKDLSFKFSGLGSQKDYSLEIFNTTGKEMQNYSVPGNLSEFNIDVESFKPGVYYAILKSARELKAVRKFIVK